MVFWKLRFSMFATLSILIGLSTLFFALILQYLGGVSLATTPGLIMLLMFVVFFNLIQWLVAPYVIDSGYRVREADRVRYARLYRVVEDLVRRMKMKMPKLMISELPIPNAFAYGSPIAGSRVAVTTGLLRELEEEEVEAVIGHELGHLKHRDVQVMMFASVLPAIFYILGSSLLMSSWYGGGRRNGGAGAIALAGFLSIIIYWILSLLTLQLSRLREYYADRRSATTVDDGARKLSEALAKIVHSTSRAAVVGNVKGLSAFKTLFIEDPDKAVSNEMILLTSRGVSDQALVKSLLNRKVTSADRIVELFSTHPNIVKRLRSLEKLRVKQGS